MMQQRVKVMNPLDPDHNEMLFLDINLIKNTP
jgi:hypothetical protein